MNKLPAVSVIIPCRNEERLIGKCLDSVLANDYPKDELELLVVDGLSEDRTRAIVREYAGKYLFIKLHDNPQKIVPTAMNIGIKNAQGEIIVRMDAHNTYEKDYISKCVQNLRRLHADNVGGVWVTMPGSDTLVAKSIALALSHPFGVGNAHFRIGSKEPKDVDTVPFGCYNKNIFNNIGLFNEHLVRNQDIEFNIRLKKSGGKIFLIPNIISYYHARSTLRALAKNNFWNGFWVVYSTKFAKMPFSVRHLIPLVFILSLLCTLLLSLFHRSFLFLFLSVIGLYGGANILFSLKLALKHNLKYFLALITSFMTLHFSYGLGSILGSLKLLIHR